MTLATPVDTQTVTNVIKFVDCCTGQEIFFRGFLPISDGEVYSYIGTTPFPGTGGTLQPNKCYTLFLLYYPVTSYPPAPTTAQLDAKSVAGCEDSTCLDCNPKPACECPEGFTDQDGECVKITTTTATYTGDLFPLVSGSKSEYYCDAGLRLYPDITTMTWPILGNGSSNSNYTLNQNNGAGPVVTPTANVQSAVWGKSSNPCATGNTGGRLNIAGVWATGFPANQELSFEFCINIEGSESKQYMIGIAGDNYVKFYVDGNLAVFLNTPGSSVTTPFRNWHTFPITLAPGNHIIKLAGLNLGGDAAFAAEIYDITLSQFQATLMNPAVALGNCGTTPAQLEPYILFTTADMVDQEVPNPATPGEWVCPPGATLDICNGVPVCVFEEKLTLVCDCYMIIPCDGTDPFVTNNQDFAPVVNSFVTVSSGDYTGCAYVVLLENTDCNESVNVILQDTPCTCILNCYYVENTNGFLYVDENSDLQEVSSIDAKPYVKVCSRIYPVVESNSQNFQIIELGPCEDNTCPTQCFKLTSCEDSAIVIYSNSDALIPYVYGTENVVRIIGREGCWIASELDPDEICDCPIDVVVTSSYATCEECIPVVSYKLTSCINNDVIYTLDDLEAYVGQTVKLDCGCYTVEQLDILPPNPQTVVIDDVFRNCIECLRTYWKLVDCTGVSEDIYTYTDLTLYENKVIKIEGCDTCWTVEATEEHINPVTVNVVSSFDECIDCNTDLPCLCSKMTNVSDLPVNYVYLDCDHNLVDITVNPGVSTDKICAIQWYRKYCNCFILKISIELSPEIISSEAFPVTNTGELLNGYPVYSVCDGPNCTSLFFNGTNWVVNDNSGNVLYILQTQTSGTCPFGTWVGGNGEPIPNTTIETYAADDCGDIPFAYVDLVYTDYVEYFGECKQGVCPQPVFKNNRTVRPGYNTPICTPEKYDMITCKFADVLYKIALEKRYGITNCCPDEDDKWLIQKELIDLQALKDPNYNCAECKCSCGPVNMCETCNCKN